ncbi:MAG: ATP-binding cassette domain-containing protein [Gammaproteobacteria bacterium]|nr:ATP-binding cassette domain-containing protein [Gammaproteobacteria bacterium]
MITLQNIELARGTKLLFASANVSFYDKQKIGIVGKNGSGKTSLFLLLQGLLESSAGNVLFPEKLRIVTIEQEVPVSDKSALDYVIDGCLELKEYQKALKEAEFKQDGLRIAELYDLIQQIDGFSAEARAAKILKGLGFAEKEMTSSVNSLSGGWRMRLNIARSLFVPSDVLLLDEPTNHLDLDAVIWLEKWLQQYPGLLMFISHDREFLDEIVDHIVQIENKELKIYSGNYSGFEKQRIAALAVQQQQHEKQQKQIEHIESFIRRFKAKATKARQAQSRVKALARMQEIMPAHIDSPFSFEFIKPVTMANPLLLLQGVSFSYTDKPVLNNVCFQLNSQDRIALLGRNGAGKSTLIKLLAGKLRIEVGRVTHNKKLKIGYFAQHSLEELDGSASPLGNLQKIAVNEAPGKLRAFLGGFDFRDDMALMPVKNLSGGEKARLALALIVWQAPDVLLLDEPTNHLDLDMRQALVLALQNYDGAVVLVSHDRFLLKQVVDDYWLISDSQVKRFNGNLKEYQTFLLKTDNMEKSSKKVNDKNIKKQAVVLERKIDKLQQQIIELEKLIAELSLNPSKNMNELQEITQQRLVFIKQREDYEDEWLQVMDG